MLRSNAVAGVPKDSVELEAAGAGVRADGHVQLPCPFVERVEVGVVDEAAADLDAAQVDGDGAVVLSEPELAFHLVHGQYGNHSGPAEASLAFGVDVGHPAVVASADGGLFGGVVGDGACPHRGEEDLQVGAEFVHVGDARLHVQHELGISGQRDVTDEDAELAARAAARPRRPDGASVDDPVLHHLAAFEGLVGSSGLVLTLRGVHVLPRLVDLDHVRVCIDDSHLVPPYD